MLEEIENIRIADGAVTCFDRIADDRGWDFREYPDCG